MTLLSSIAVRSWTEMLQTSDDVQLALFRQASARPSSDDVKTGFRAFAANLLAPGSTAAQPMLDLISIAQAEFDAVLGDRPNQVDRQRDDVARWDRALTDHVDNAVNSFVALHLVIGRAPEP